MIIDAHLHCTGRERVGDVLTTLDDAEVDVGVLLAPFLTDGYSLNDACSLERANRHLSRLIEGHRDRLIGLGVINPLHPNAVTQTIVALDELGLHGLKMVPSGWIPADDCAQAVFAAAAVRGAPILFHSGIFIDGRSGRYCRPVEFEAVRNQPGIRATLAHLGWPWCDEANAVGLIDRINGVAPDASQFRFDISFGAPEIYRYAVLQNALAVLGADLLQFGSDCFLPCPGSELRSRRAVTDTLFDELAIDSAARARIYAGTASAWLQLPGI